MEKIKKYFRKLCCLFIVLVGVLAVFSPTKSVQAKDHYRITGFGADFAPFNYQNANGELTGIDHDIADAIAENQGFTIEKIDMPFNSSLQALEQGQVDAMMAAMSITPEREEKYDFTDSYFDSSTSFAAKSDQDYETLDDLRGKKIAVKTGAMGSRIADNLKDEYDFEVLSYEDSTSMYQAVMGGNADAVVDETPVMQYAISTGRVDLKLVGDPQEPAPLGVAVVKGENQELLDKFNKGLAEIKESGEYDEIIKKHLGEDALEPSSQKKNFWERVKGYLPSLWEGLKVTLYVAVISIVLATILGAIFGIIRFSEIPVLSALVKWYINIIRGVPMIVLAFFIYFALPQFLGIKIPEVTSGIIVVTLNATAYIAETIRGGIQSVDKGQMEAALSLGLSRRDAMGQVVLPQAFRVMIPSLLNQFVISLKDTSILSAIGVIELTQAGKIIIARTFESAEVWFLVGVIYFIIISALTAVSNRLENKLK